MKVVTICGSLRKVERKYWDALAENLTMGGYCVFTVNVWNKYDYLHSKEGKPHKRLLDLIHKQKIAVSQKVYVLRTEHYIGESTKSEIDFAQSMNIPITYIDVDLCARARMINVEEGN